ncbi:hypothetical protein B0H67DRAFT_549972 [Lasiosphaeris hirsuta]|uniref:F-box domain-containing protein n=1 Tax=Lasiosphaeris hirsuta TaxID=260670 RepID=A0AA40AY54_9PEZI|nr:hypothetical protein B0H67DRAFT_549972 [Lasiosphaeris hirsuta]
MKPTVSTPPTAPDDDPPAWLRNQQTNAENSWLYRLPTEILLEIRKHTDDVTRAAMRNTCSMFLTLVADLPSHEACTFRDILGGIFVSSRDRKEVQAMLKRNLSGKCDECRAFCHSGRYDKTIRHFRKREWCSGCRRSHARFYFSAAQRALPPTERVCIGREGRLRLCDDQHVTWSGLTGPDPSAARSTNMSTAYAYLNKASHLTSFQKGFPPKIRIAKVKRFDIGIRIENINTHWAIPVMKLDPSTPVTKQQLQTHLTAARNTFGVSLCPHVEIDDGQLLLPFAQEYCVCFDNAPKTEPPHNHSPHSASSDASCIAVLGCQHENLKCCRCRPADGRRNFFRPDVDTVLKGSDNLVHMYTCPTCFARYSWIRARNTWIGLGNSWTPGSASDRHVYLEFLRDTSTIDVPTDLSWIRQLDPESWGASTDEELRHVTWCADSRCTTISRRRGQEKALDGCRV